jgi:hypothetical protein
MLAYQYYGMLASEMKSFIPYKNNNRSFRWGRMSNINALLSPPLVI